MKVEEIEAKSIITESGLPDSDFVINPYVGCVHGCVYCYARFMKKFTDHDELWGEFLDVKINAPDLIPQNTDKYQGKSITIASVTDPYQPIEEKYELTRKILEKLIPLEPDLCVMTKSDLITRDIDLLKQFEQCKAGISLSTIDNDLKKEVEPGASLPNKRLEAVEKLNEAGINTFAFISPILPELTDWRKIVEEAEEIVDEIWFENLNVKGANRESIKQWLQDCHPDLIQKYNKIYSPQSNYWSRVEQEIKDYCEDKGLGYKIYFHHSASYS